MCRSAELLRTRSIIHRRGDSFSSLRSDDDVGDLGDFEQRPLFFMHGVGLGLVSARAKPVALHQLLSRKTDLHLGQLCKSAS